jgi:L-2-hydroxyglutarate oxidase
MSPWIEKFLEPPVGNKVRLAMNRDFLALSVQEMWSSLSKGEMLRRVQRFLPALREEHLVSQGTAGIRSPVVNRDGAMMKEAIEIPGPHSYHILNYNSPGATGAPAYAAYLVDRLAARGDLDHLKKNPKPPKAWDWDVIATAMGFGA